MTGMHTPSQPAIGNTSLHADDSSSEGLLDDDLDSYGKEDDSLVASMEDQQRAHLPNSQLSSIPVSLAANGPDAQVPR